MTAAARHAALEVLTAHHDSTLTPHLAQMWPGWGCLAATFGSDPDPAWADFHAEIADLLTDDEYRSASMVCDTSFYTPSWLAEQMWRLIDASGFSGRSVLYPGFGSGALLAGAPAGLEVTGVEVDGVSAAVAAARHPHVHVIHSALERVTFPVGGFDLAIGNVPFSNSYVYDSAKGATMAGVHHYFIARMLEAVRPGGLVAVITSRHSMDGGSERYPGAELSTAIRLPSGLFPGTDVSADLLLIRKSADPGRSLPTEREALLDASGRVTDCMVSRYWALNPSHVCGEVSSRWTPQGWRVIVSHPDPRQIVTATVGEVCDLLPYDPSAGDVPALDVVGDIRDEGAFVIDAATGVVTRTVNGEARPVPQSAELVALVRLRDMVQALMEAEADHDVPDDALTPARTELRSAYRAYVDRWGALNRGTLREGKLDPETGQPKLSWSRPRMGGFRRDPRAHLVWALEHHNASTGECSEAAILTERVNRHVPRVARADSPAEALTVTLSEAGRVDMARVAELLGCDEDSAAEQLAGLIYHDPTCGWVTAAEYLSGDIGAKIEAAAAAGLTANVAALEAVAPTPLVPGEIRPRLGAPWVGAADVQEFIKQLLTDGSGHVSVDHCPFTARWEVSARPTAAAAALYGVPDLTPAQLIEDALNGKSIIVTTSFFDNETQRWRHNVRDAEQTMAAQERLALIQGEFETWLWADPDRCERVVADYNRRFNRITQRRYDGSYLTFPGLSSNEPLWEWQTAMVDRNLNTPATLCGHAVGAGKTRTMLATAWMLRRYNIATKPLMVVPNHLLEQVAAEAVQMFPAGKWLIAGTDDLSGDARRLFAARCATGDWDGVILTHSAFVSIPVHPLTEQQFLNDQITEHQQALRDGAHSYSGKQIARRLRGLQTRLENSRGGSDPATVYFEHLGVDHLSVDEADAFIRLPIVTAATGFSLGSSKRAVDLRLKKEYLSRGNPDRPHFAAYTGTPWRNTIAETYIWQLLLQPGRLTDAGLSAFDAWAAQFVTMVSRVEPAPDGSGLRIATRPTRFQNLPEMWAMLGDVADIKTRDQLPLPRPDVARQMIVVEPSPSQQAITASLIERSRKLQASPRAIGPGSDNMLAIVGAGRSSALDPLLAGGEGASPKVLAAARTVARVWEQNKDRVFPGSPLTGVLQLVFCDLGTPRPGDSQTYGRLRAAMIACGVPADVIRFVHDASDDKSKARLFAQCRTGEVQVLIASTQKAGLGTTVQTRLAAIHHVDAPWRPCDLEQREGRGDRWGNLCGTVTMYRYITERSFDTYTWSVLLRKASWIEQVCSGVREVDDIGEVEVDFGRVAAIASGDERLFARTELAAKVQRLRASRSVAAQSAATAKKRADEMRRSAEALDRRVEHCANYLPLGAAPSAETILGWLRTDRRSGSWRGLPVDVYRTSYGTPAVHVRIGDLIRESVSPRKIAGKSALRWVQTLLDEAESIVENVPQMVERASRLRAEADAAEAFANAWTFPQQGLLEQAEADLAAVDAELRDEAAA